MTHTPEYLLIGHMTADLTPEGRVPGGTVSYAARAAAAFGLQVGLLTSAARGEPLLAQLAPYVGQITSLPADTTTTYENLYTEAGRVQYVRGVAAPLTPADVPAHFLGAPLVHLAPIAGELDPQVAHLFKDSLVLLTLQGWLRRWESDGLVRFKRWHDADVLKSIDIVVFSEEDILEAPEMEADFAGTVEHLFVTRAEKGGSYYHHGQRVDYETPTVEVTNPTGAGDIFATSLLASLHHFNGAMPQAIRVAAQMGATAVTRFGLDGAPTRAEVEAALAQAAQAHRPHDAETR